MTKIQRRTLMATATAATAALTLAGCSVSDAQPPTTEPEAGGALPNFFAYDGPKPDLLGDAETGVPDGYLSYPDPPVRVIEQSLGLSAPVTVLTQGSTPGVPPSRNQWFRKMAEDLGVELDVVIVQSSEYAAKLQTSIAGNALSDITLYSTVPELPAVLDRMFTDLTPYLAGDEVQKYPALAAIPTAAWRAASVNGRVFGIPQARVPAGMVLMTNGDILEQRGIDAFPELGSGVDFLDLCREVSDPGDGRFAVGQLPGSWTMPLILEALGAPNGWRIEDAGWVSTYETPEYEQALEIVSSMVKEGLFHPNSQVDNTNQMHEWFRAGTTAMFAQNFANWQQKSIELDTTVGAVRMPQWDGGGLADKHLGPSAYSAPAGIRKMDDQARVDEILQVANYLCSPFGTQEYLTANYGIAGRQFDLKDGHVVLREDGPKEHVPGLTYVGSALQRVLYVPNRPDVTETLQSYCAEVVPTGNDDPSRGLFSETDLTKGAVARRILIDAQNGILQGRAGVATWKDAVAAWKRSAGDAVAQELAEAHAASQ